MGDATPKQEACGQVKAKTNSAAESNLPGQQGDVLPVAEISAPEKSTDIDELLAAWRHGDAAAMDGLFALVTTTSVG